MPPDRLIDLAEKGVRNARVQARSARNGRIFHATGAMRWGRDTALRTLGPRLVDLPWLYGDSKDL